METSYFYPLYILWAKPAPQTARIGGLSVGFARKLFLR